MRRGKFAEIFNKHKKLFGGLMSCIIVVTFAVIALEHTNYIDIKNGRTLMPTLYMGRTAEEIENIFGEFDFRSGYSEMYDIHYICGYTKEVRRWWNKDNVKYYDYYIFFDEKGIAYESHRIRRSAQSSHLEEENKQSVHFGFEYSVFLL